MTVQRQCTIFFCWTISFEADFIALRRKTHQSDLSDWGIDIFHLFQLMIRMRFCQCAIIQLHKRMKKSIQPPHTHKKMHYVNRKIGDMYIKLVYSVHGVCVLIFSFVQTRNI